MTATITTLPTPGDDSHESDEDRKRRKARDLAHGDLLVAARLLFTAQHTVDRLVGDPATAQRLNRVRHDVLAILAGEDTPSEIEYGDLAADASAYCAEVETLREELESVQGCCTPGKGN